MRVILESSFCNSYFSLVDGGKKNWGKNTRKLVWEVFLETELQPQFSMGPAFKKHRFNFNQT
jgi:hypothetical protein